MKIKNINAHPAARRAFRPLAAAFACGAGLLAGCATQPESHMVSAPPPPAPTRSVTTTTTATSPESTPAVVVQDPANGMVTAVTPAVSTTVVSVAPPALQPEVVLAQPTPEHVWLAGYWTWRDNGYQWMAGHWQLPPHSHALWISPRWEQQGNAYKFYEGYWN